MYKRQGTNSSAGFSDRVSRVECHFLIYYKISYLGRDLPIHAVMVIFEQVYRKVRFKFSYVFLP